MSDTKPKINTNTLIVCGTLAFMACLGAFVFLSVSGRDTAQYVAFLAFALGAIPGTAAWKNSRDVKEQTNGPLTGRLDSFQSQLDTQDRVLKGIMQRLGMNPDEHLR